MFSSLVLHFPPQLGCLSFALGLAILAALSLVGGGGGGGLAGGSLALVQGGAGAQGKQR